MSASTPRSAPAIEGDNPWPGLAPFSDDGRNRVGRNRKMPEPRPQRARQRRIKVPLRFLTFSANPFSALPFFRIMNHRDTEARRIPRRPRRLLSRLCLRALVVKLRRSGAILHERVSPQFQSGVRRSEAVRCPDSDISHSDVEARHPVNLSFRGCHCEQRSDEAIHRAESPRPRPAGSR